MSTQLASTIMRQRSCVDFKPPISRQSSREFASIWRQGSRDFSACVQQSTALDGAQAPAENIKEPKADSSYDFSLPHVMCP